MSLLKIMWKAFRKLWGHGPPTTGDIDVHKWESKVELLRNLSSKHH
jgi:hypothetical protein